MKTSSANKKLVGVGVYIVSEDTTRLLLTQRGPKARHEHYKWEGPGGALELGETFEEAAHREIREELGITITLGPMIAEFKGLVDPNGDDLDAQIFSATTDETPSIQEPAKCVGFGWFTKEEIAHLNLAEYVVKDLEAFGWL
jgi:8-oxo-dGTP pyrophosphatase MutT (NUDIX family)